MDFICLTEFQLILIVSVCIVGTFLWLILMDWLAKKDKEIREKEIKKIIELYKNERK